MLRLSPLLRRYLSPIHRPALPFTAQNPATYSLGLSYASKNSPPFVPIGSEAPQKGFANRAERNGLIPRISAFVENGLSRRAGRGVLSEAAVGGWDDRIALDCKTWGAGEDFFCILDREWMREDYAIPQAQRWLHLAISDGVGGWGDTVDPSLFPQMLMYQYAERMSAAVTISSWDIQQVLQAAHRKLLRNDAVPMGSATACAISLQGNGLLHGLNIGDSGCMILREGKMLFATRPRTHYFNCPFQLSKVPDNMARGIIRDSLWDEQGTDLFTAELLPGDVVILYTDGLSDNVPADHIPLLHAQICNLLAHPSNAHLTNDERVAEMARLFADVLVGYGRMAMARTGDEPGWKTPFEVEARKEGYAHKGGKVDDITVITAVVGKQEGDDSPSISSIE